MKYVCKTTHSWDFNTSIWKRYEVEVKGVQQVLKDHKPFFKLSDNVYVDKFL